MGDKDVEELCKQYPKFKAFAADIDACLQVFEKSKDWSDYVGALSKLIKVFQRPDYADQAKVGSVSVIPEKALVARRLAQCTNSILPQGVHKRALDAYLVILTRIGPRQLAVDLPLWSSGLFALFPHANAVCKTLHLSLLTSAFLPLQRHLTPCLSGLLLSLLPGIEDETSPFYHETLQVLGGVREAVGKSLYYQALWWVLGTSQSSRQALLYLLERELARERAMRGGRGEGGGVGGGA